MANTCSKLHVLEDDMSESDKNTHKKCIDTSQNIPYVVCPVFEAVLFLQCSEKKLN